MLGKTAFLTFTVLSVLAIAIALASAPATAGFTYSESFTTTTYKDPVNTSAEWVGDAELRSTAPSTVQRKEPST